MPLIRWLRRLLLGTKPAQPARDTTPEKKAKKKPEAKPEAPKPPPNKWAAAVGQIRATCDWLTGAMGAIAVAAVGSGAFLGFERVDSWLRAGWVVWGLSLTVVGALVVLWQATLVKLPISASIGALVGTPDQEFAQIVGHLNLDRRKQQIPSMDEEVDARKRLDDERWTLVEKIAGLKAATDPAAKQERATSEARLEFVDAKLTEVGGNLTGSLHRAMYLTHRRRFMRALPWLIGGALMVAVGFPTYFAAARLDAEDDTPDAGDTRTVPVVARATFTAQRVVEVHPTCLARPAVEVLVMSGNGTAAAPWQLRVLPTESCPSAFDLTVSAADATVVAVARDPALTTSLTPPAAPEPEGACLGHTPPECFSVATWGVTAVGYLLLLVATSRTRDPEV